MYFQVRFVCLEDDVVEIARNVELHLGFRLMLLHIAVEGVLHRIQPFLRMCLQIHHCLTSCDVLGVGEDEFLRPHHGRVGFKTRLHFTHQLLHPAVILFC